MLDAFLGRVSLVADADADADFVTAVTELAGIGGVQDLVSHVVRADSYVGATVAGERHP